MRARVSSVRTTTADSLFGELPAGSFTLSASKPGFVETFYGSKHPGRGPGVRIAVTSGQRVEISLKILPGAVITGVVSDSRGYPISGVAVQAVELRGQGRVSDSAVRAVSDDRGMYRLFGLAPGDYVISANPRLVPYGLGPNANFGEVSASLMRRCNRRARMARAVLWPVPARRRRLVCSSATRRSTFRALPTPARR